MRGPQPHSPNLRSPQALVSPATKPDLKQWDKNGIRGRLRDPMTGQLGEIMREVIKLGTFGGDQQAVFRTRQ
jgi:hypothetical protein